MLGLEEARKYRRKYTFQGVFLGCGGLLLLEVVFFLFLLITHRSEMRRSEPTARQYLQYMIDNKPTEAYELSSMKFRNVANLDTVKSIFALYRQNMGHMGTPRQLDWHTVNKAGITAVEFIYSVPSDKANITATIDIEREGGEYRVLTGSLVFTPYNTQK